MAKSSKGFLDERITRRFYERIAEVLGRRPVELQPAVHRERLKELLGRLGEMSFYELLGVKPGATEEDVHAAYSELAKLVHPSHAERLGMRSNRGALELLFERATEAYLTLNDPDRSRLYEMATGIAPASSAQPSAEERRKEQIDQGARLVRVAKGLMTEAKYYDAVQTLRQAVKLDPKAESYALLGECLARNPNWLREAVAAYESAVERSPHDPSLRTELALVLERGGQIPRAEEQYRTALSLDPDFLDAQTGIDRLRSRRVEPEERTSAWERLVHSLRKGWERFRSS